MNIELSETSAVRQPVGTAVKPDQLLMKLPVDFVYRAIKALEESIDAVQSEYENYWGKDSPMRTQKMQQWNQLIEEHKNITRDLKIAIGFEP